MPDFSVRHGIKPTIEKFRFEQVNTALDHLCAGKAGYRSVLEH